MKENKISILIKQRRKINSLENKVNSLENAVKDKLYKEFMGKLGEPMEIARLKKENKRLRASNKELRKIIKGED